MNKTADETKKCYFSNYFKSLFYFISTLGWHQNEHVLTNLNCGREYHVYVVLFNALGASPASQVLTTRTLGNRPTAPTSSYDFILANTTFLRYVV